jgi:hypothetical protein
MPAASPGWSKWSASTSRKPLEIAGLDRRDKGVDHRRDRRRLGWRDHAPASERVEKSVRGALATAASASVRASRRAQERPQHKECG